MANNWNIPEWLEKEVRARDTACVYCGNEFTSVAVSRKSVASWEHIINDARIITRENIALCCCGCNASKGQKPLASWLQTNYCKDRSITPETVAPVIKQALKCGGVALSKELKFAPDLTTVHRTSLSARRLALRYAFKVDLLSNLHCRKRLQ